MTEALPEPSYTDGQVALYGGDCLELLARLPESSIDLTVTSPPYNIGKEYERPMTLSSYLDWCEDWMELIYRASARSSSFWLNLGYVQVRSKGKAVPIPYLLWDRTQFFLHQEIVWHYAAGVSTRHSFAPRNEKFLWYVKSASDYTFNLDAVRDPDVKYPNQKKNGKLKCNPLGKNPGDVWAIPKVTSGANRSSPERTPHPAQFPIAVIERIVHACSNDGDILVDPFAGSATTLEVALMTGRKAIGFEVRKDYVDLAVERIERFKKNQALALLQQPLSFDE